MTDQDKSSSSFWMEWLEERCLRSASLLADINPGSTSSLPDNFNVVGKQVLFLAYDPTHGQMLWSTNGTAAGTFMVKDINPNPASGTYQGFGGDSMVIGNEMYFTGATAADGVQLWETDGTAAGTQMVTDLNPGGGDADPTGFTNFNGKLAFAALGQLWVTDGTSAGTISLGDFNPTGVDGTVDRMAVLGNKLYFMRYNPADSDGQSTGELWETDGTVAGTPLVMDVSPGNDGSESVNSEPSDLINVNGELYFAADDGAHGWELWKSDGTSAGTQMVDDLAPPPASGSPEDGSYPANLVDVNNTLYFTASADYGLPSLYTLDAATQQPVLVDPAADRPVDPQQLTPAGDGFFFTAQTSSGGTALWYSNGMAAGTSQIATINPNGEPNISAMTAMGGELYFTADDGVHGGELWCSDGTAVGTQLLADVQAGAGSSSPGTVTDFNDTLIFNADVDGVGEEPFADSLSAPVAPTASLMMAMKSGLSNDAQPTVTGTATAGATVYLFADGRPVASGVAGSTGQFVVQSTVPLANGKHELTVADEIDGVTSSNSAPLSLTIDTTRPTDKLLSASNASISIRFSQDVSATLKKGDFRLVNMKTGKSVASADLGVSYNRKNNTARIRFKHLKNGSLPTGHYELAISSHKVLDAAGNALAAEPLVLTIRKKAK